MRAKLGDAASAFLPRHGPAARLLKGTTSARSICRAHEGHKQGVFETLYGLIRRSLPALRSNRAYAASLIVDMEITRSRCCRRKHRFNGVNTSSSWLWPCCVSEGSIGAMKSGRDSESQMRVLVKRFSWPEQKPRFVFGTFGP